MNILPSPSSTSCTTHNLGFHLLSFCQHSVQNVSWMALLNTIKIICDQIFPIIKMSKFNSKHIMNSMKHSMKTENHGTIRKRRRLSTCLTIRERRTNGSRFGKKMNKLVCFCILTKFFNQPTGLESHAQSSLLMIWIKLIYSERHCLN